MPTAVAEPSPTPQAAPPAGGALADAGTKPTPLPMRPDAAESISVAASPRPAATPPAPRAARLLAPPPVASANAAANAASATTATATATAADPLRPAPPWADQALPASRWQLVDPSAGAVDPAWLQALNLSTQGRWQATAARRPDGATPLLLACASLAFGGTAAAHDTWRHFRLWLEARSVLWCPAVGVCQRARLTEAEALELRNRLPR